MSKTGGNSFYNRDEETQIAWKLLQNEDVLLLAPRRVGKSMLMRHLAEQSQNRQETCAVYLTVEGARDEAHFVKILADELKQAAFGRLKRWGHGAKEALSRIEKIDVASLFGIERQGNEASQWETAGEELVNCLRGLRGHWVLLVDEFPVFVQKLLREDTTNQRALNFLNWFRGLRQQPNTGAAGRVSWLLAGSIGLDVVASRNLLGTTINDLKIMDLGPFSRDHAEKFLEKLALDEDVRLSASVSGQICDAVGWLIPYHLKILFDEWRMKGAANTANAVAEAFASLLDKTPYFDTWHQRLAEELGRPWDGVARALLNSCAADVNGAAREVLRQRMSNSGVAWADEEQEFRWLLEVLRKDGYLVEQSGRFVFRSHLLRAYWHQRFVA